MYSKYYQNQAIETYVRGQIYSSLLTTDNLADHSITGVKLATETMTDDEKDYYFLAFDDVGDVIY
jgi:hypothetical protein